MKREIQYWIEDHGGSLKDAYSFEYSSPYKKLDIEDIATDAADDYHSNHDGWETSWPLIFSLADDNGNLLGRASVELEARPYFSGRALE